MNKVSGRLVQAAMMAYLYGTLAQGGETRTPEPPRVLPPNYHKHIPKAQRRGKSWQEIQAMRAAGSAPSA